MKRLVISIDLGRFVSELGSNLLQWIPIRLPSTMPIQFVQFAYEWVFCCETTEKSAMISMGVSLKPRTYRDKAFLCRPKTAKSTRPNVKYIAALAKL